MTLTYIFHSGFVLEAEQSILVFDYWLDPSGVMDSVIQSEKPMAAQTAACRGLLRPKVNVSFMRAT